jgi:cell division septation protein DedD
MKQKLFTLFALLLAVATAFAQNADSLQTKAQQAFVAGNYLQAAKTYSEWASSTSDRKKKIEALYWESLSRFQAVERGEEIVANADSVLQKLLVTADPGDSLYFAGQLLGAYMSLQKNPEQARKRYEVAQLQPFRNLEPRNLFVGYLVYTKTKNKAKADKLKDKLLRNYPSSPEAQNLGSQVAKRTETTKRNALAKSSSSTVRTTSSSAAVLTPASSENRVVAQKLSSSEKSRKKLSSSATKAKLSSSASLAKATKKEEKKTEAKTSPVTQASSGEYYLQLGAFSSETQAKAFVEKVKKQGVSGKFAVDFSGNRHKVRIYGFKSRDAANDFGSQKLKPKKLDFLVVLKQN